MDETGTELIILCRCNKVQDKKIRKFSHVVQTGVCRKCDSKGRFILGEISFYYRNCDYVHTQLSKSEMKTSQVEQRVSGDFQPEIQSKHFVSE